MDEAEFWTDIEQGTDLKARSVRGASVTALAQGPKVLLTLASQILLARLLLPIDFGLIAMVMPVIGFVQVLADLGLTQAVVSSPKLRLSDLNAFFLINLAFSLGLALLTALTGPVLSWIYDEPRIIPLTVACSALIVVGGVGMVPGALLNRQLRFGAIAMVDVVAMTVSVAAGAIAALLDARYWSLVIMTAAFSGTQTALNWHLARWRPTWVPRVQGAWSLARFGGSITVSNLAGYLNMSLDNVLVGAVLGGVVLGLYDRAWRLAVLPLAQIQAPFNRVAVPVLSRLTDAPERYRVAFIQMAQAMLLLVTPAMMYASATSSALIAFVLGPRWLPAAPIFSWLCLGAAITPVNVTTFWLLVSQGRAREQMIYGAAAAAINVCAYAVGLHWGIMGVAKVSIASVYLLQSPMLIWAACRRGPVGFADMAGLLPNVLAAVTLFLVLEQWTRSHPVAGFLPLAATAAASFLIYLMVLSCFRGSRTRLRAALHLRLMFLTPATR